MDHAHHSPSPAQPKVPDAVMAHPHRHHDGHHDGLLAKLLLGGGLVTAAIIATPLIAGGMYNAGWISDSVGEAVVAATNSCQGAPQGMAATVAGWLSHVPLIGEGLAEGGLTNTLASATLGIGGMLLGHYVANHEDGSKKIRWGNVIKTAALATSFLVASPAIFTALSMGLTFLGTLARASTDFFTQVMSIFGTTGAGSIAPGAAGLGVIGAHLLSCGPAILGLAATAGSHKLLNKLDDRLAASPASAPAHEHDVPPGESTHRIKILSVEPPLQKGVESSVEFCLTDLKTNRILHEPEMEVMHGMPIHAFVTEPSLSEYHHVHPQAVEGKNGVFAYKITPQGEQGYKMFADIHPKGSHYQALQTPLPGKGKALSAEVTRQEHPGMQAESAFAR